MTNQTNHIKLPILSFVCFAVKKQNKANLLRSTMKKRNEPNCTETESRLFHQKQGTRQKRRIMKLQNKAKYPHFQSKIQDCLKNKPKRHPESFYG